MSTLARLRSASIAAWCQIAVNMLAQLLLVPVFLSRWDRETYGVWLVLQAALAMSTILDVSHQTFVGFEALRLGSQRRDEVRSLFSAAIPVAFALAALQLATIVLMVSTGWDRNIFDFGTKSADAGFVLILQSAIWLVTGALGGVAMRVLWPFGYFPRFSWWGAFFSVIVAVVPAAAVLLGAQIRGAGIALAISTVLINIPVYVDLAWILRRERLAPERPNLRLGWSNFRRSLSLSLKSLFEMARQQGTRLLLAPLAGAAEMASFATMRTGANLALQSLNTVTHPLLPELMRFLNDRDQHRTEASFGAVWLIVSAALVPGVIVAQLLAPWLFPYWTRGKIAFEPELFALLSTGVLVFAIAQPAMAVTQGNNLLRGQLAIAAACALAILAGLVMLVPTWGIKGAALVLLLVETGSLIAYIAMSARWLGAHNLAWPTHQFFRVCTSAAIGAGTIQAMAIRTDHQISIAATGLAMSIACVVWLWRGLPEFARSRLLHAIIPGTKR